MSAGLLPLRLVTPRGVRVESVALLRLRDASGHFAIQRGHADFLTCLEPGLGYWRGAGGARVYLAVDAGVLRVRRGVAEVASREIFTHEDPAELSATMERVFRRRDESERAFYAMLADLEKAFLRKSLDLARGR